MKARFLVVFLTVFLLTNARAQSQFIWTTTNDFAGGTRELSFGNSTYTTETNLENPFVNPSELWIANRGGDRFALLDAEGNTYKWSVDDAGISACGRGVDGTVEVRDGIYLMHDPEPMVDTVEIVSRGGYSDQGDAIELNVTVALSNGSIGNQFSWALWNEQVCASITVDGGVIAITFLGAGIYDVVAEFQSNGLSDGICGLALEDQTDPTFVLTIKRLPANLWSFFYNDEHLGTCTRNYGTNALFATFEAGALTAQLDDFRMVQGDLVITSWIGTLTADDNIFRGGNWTSSTFAAERVMNLTIRHDVNAAAYIDKVEFRKDGIVLQTFPNDITSGSQTTYALDNQTGTGFDVKIYFLTDGTDIPRVFDVTVTVNPFTRHPIPGSLVWLIFIGTVLSFIIVLAARKRRGGRR